MADAMIELALRAVENRDAILSDIEPRPDTPGIAAVVLLKARHSAAKALIDLAEADAEDPKEIRRLQNEVRRYFDILGWVNQAIASGKESLQFLRNEREDMQVLREMTSEDDGEEPDGFYANDPDD